MQSLLFRSSRIFLPRAPVRSFSVHQPLQAGHNKWSKIKDKKGAADAQKSILYTKINRPLLVGGSADPEKNIQLSTVLKKAKDLGVPKDNIEKALANAAKGKEQNGERLVYEALAEKTVGLVIECITDNTNRTIHNVREILTKHSAHMTPVNFMFNRRGCVTVSLDGNAPEHLDGLMAAVENDATDVDEMPVSLAQHSPEEEQTFWVFCEPESLAALEESIEKVGEKLGATIKSSEIAHVPVDRNPKVDEDVREKVRDLVDDLEADGDISKVWTSLDYPMS
ncbi:YebC-like protein [Agrocybe pediades]|nr:YebC-like protein [Agrocybe pediades]